MANALDVENTIPQLDEFVPLLPTKNLGAAPATGLADSPRVPVVPTAETMATTKATSTMAALLADLAVDAAPVATPKTMLKPSKKSAAPQPSLFDEIAIDDAAFDLQPAPQVVKEVTPHVMAQAARLPSVGFVAPAFERVAPVAEIISVPPVMPEPVEVEDYAALRAGLISTLHEVIASMEAVALPQAEQLIPATDTVTSTPAVGKSADDYMPFGDATFRMACM